MRKPLQAIGRAGLVALLLALGLICGSFVFRTSAHAQVKMVRNQAMSTVASSVEVVRWRGRGKVIVVSLSRQRLYAYRHGHLVFSAPVTTGQPALPTPLGRYRIYARFRQITFHSPFPRRSRYWYPPTHINYALEWKPGYFLHDAWWRTVFGRGTNRLHRDPVYGWEPGSHGCVSMSIRAARWLYHWAPIGTIVRIMH